MKRIQLGGHKRPHAVKGWALVDDDYERLSQWRWSLIGGYAARMDPGTRRLVLMHRAVMGLIPGDGQHCDHMSRDRLDNRRCNLRVVTQAVNNQNRAPRGGSSRHRGVRANRKRWQAYCWVGGKFHHLGVFEDEDEAGRAALAGRQRWLEGAVD